MDKQELWQLVLSTIEPNISRPNFLTWFQETGIMDINENEVIVCVPNGFAREWLQNKYHKTILHTIREASPNIKDINYVIGKTDFPTQMFFKNNLGKVNQNKNEPRERRDLSFKEFGFNQDTNLNPKYSLDNFIVGSFNELAHAAAQSVIKNPGIVYNPLFIYGGVGLGKTHLMQAIGNTILKKNQNYKIKYISSEKFMVEILDALRDHEMNKLKEKYRNSDVLIMDDIQFISRTEKMQEEFFHTFNALYEKNKQIIISSDRPPQAISSLEERLRSRFEGGMIADIGLPDLETRITILKSKANLKNVFISDNIATFIAENIKTNIRELEGVLNRLIINSKVSNSPISMEDARKLIAVQASAPKKFVSIKKIIKSVADFYDITEKDLITHSRRHAVLKPRQIAMYLIREEIRSSYPSIGEKFGGRDHTTALHSCVKVEQELVNNADLKEEIKAIRDRIYSS